MNDENKLRQDIETKIKTTMIGAISRIEQSFGYLWNHGSDPISESHEMFLEKWDVLRSDILNHGNNQIRSAHSILNTFLNKQNKYKYNYEFKINNRRQS